MKRSLRLRLVLVLCASMCALWGIVAAWIFTSMRHELLEVLDNRLVLSSRMVASIAHQLLPQAPAAGEPRAVPDWLPVIARDGIACEVSLVRGEVELVPLARSANSPGFSEIQSPGFGTAVKGGRLWRTYVLMEDGIRIITADRIDVREHLVQSVAYALVLPFLLVLAGILGLTWWSCKVGLAPLRRLQETLAGRPPHDPSPIRAGQDVVELAPLVGSLNALLARTNAFIEHERRWTADAAHELRTPLTAIKTHVQVAQLLAERECRQCPDSGASARIDQSLREAAQGIIHMQGALEQLLQLARLENVEAAGGVAQTEGDAIVQAFRLACSQSQRHALEQGSDPGIETRLQPAEPAAWAGVRLPLASALLTCAVTNLLDNALRHHRGPLPVLAVLALREEGENPQVSIAIRDHGPGMSAQECALAQQRFWRKHPSGAGSGLGLTIVHRIAGSAGGTLTLEPAPDGEGGLLASLRLPAALAPAPRAPGSA